ncbi:hypothetical protein DAEQUDRAFT_767776 [Daedalea quercina L-15889]|uniref:Uncharacterized protein n=1 Tax=Daedalea quercina L-15889 TaxID=1314783 RepID=A0A165N9C4_9APHY|nr:hypothetical protein DAEQUDRAFT_767776 [Daedalea quercina L-15889]
MRTSVAVAVVLAAAPSFAAPISTDVILARDYNGELEARNAKKVFGKIGHVAGGIFKTALHFLREENPELYAREFGDEDLFTRDLSELEARNAKKVFSKIGHVAGGIFKTALHFLREENPELYAREFGDDELFARKFDDELFAREFNEELYVRDVDEELFARAMDGGEIEARNAKKVLGKIGHVAGGVVKGLLHFLKREDPILARAIEENPVLVRALEDNVEVYARAIENDPELFTRDVSGELEARNAKKVLGKIGHVAGGIFKTALHFLREDTPELYARDVNDLEARNAKKVFSKIGHVAGGIFKTALHFLREENPELYARDFGDEDLYAREFDDDMLFARGMEIDELD